MARGVGAAGLGYGQGELKGEAEAWRRKQQEEALALRSLLAQRQVRQPKPEVPYPLKAMVDEQQYMMTRAHPEERNQYEASGRGAMARSVLGAWAQTGDTGTALRAFGIASQPVGSEFEPLQALAAAAPKSRAPGAYVSPAAQQQQGPAATPSSFANVRPSVNPSFAYTPTSKEQAQTGLITAQTHRIDTLLPHEETQFRQKVMTDTLDRDLSMRKANWERSADTFKMWLDQAKFLVEKGQTDYRLVADVYGKLLNFAGDLQRAGAQSGNDLNAFLKFKGAGGIDILNPAVARMKLQQAGRSPQEIEFILGSWNQAGGAVGSDAGGAPGGAPAAGGGPPTLPPIAGAPGAPGGRGGFGQPGGPSNLLEAQNWVAQAGFRITSKVGAGDRHNVGSQHYKSNAFDIGAKGRSEDEISALMQQLQRQGLTVRDERTRPRGQKVWTGPHLHVEGPRGGQPAAGQEAAPASPSYTASGTGATAGGPQSLGINLPGTVGKPPNPYTGVDSFAAEIHDLYTGGQISAAEIIREFQHNPERARRVQQIIEQANTQQGAGGVFQGLPVPSTGGAVVPNPPSPGGLAYDNAAFDRYGIGASGGNMQPGVPTRPIANTTGFPQQPEVIVEPAPAAPPSAPPPPPAAPQMVTAPPPPAAPAPATIPVPPPVDMSGPPLMGGGQGPGIEGPPLMGARRGKGGPPLAGKGKGGEKGPRVGAPNAALDAQASEFQERIARSVAAKPGGNQKAYREQIAKHEKHDFAPGVKKWLAKHKINDPATVLAVYEEALKNFARKVAGAPKGQRASRMFKLLEEQLKPAS